MEKFKFRLHWSEQVDGDIEIEAENAEEARNKLKEKGMRSYIDELSEAGAVQYAGMTMGNAELLE